MSSVATALAYFGGAIFLIAFLWKSRDFFREAWMDAQANQFPPRKCLLLALAHTTLVWLLIIGSFVIFGIATVKYDSLLMGFLIMGVFVVVVIALLIKLTNSMPIKARDLDKGDADTPDKPSADPS
jgi:hypothetical protein